MTTTEATSLFDALVADIARRYARGRILVAIDGPDAAATARFADELAGAFGSAGREARRTGAHADVYRAGEDHTALRAELAAFRKEDGDAYLLVDGRFLLRPELRGAWHFTVWLEGDLGLAPESYAEQVRYVRDENPRTHADVMYDVTDADLPQRVWGDSC